ncbi:MAG: hypothetical protein RLY16_2248 [Bacteroidota bacterium]|jgi:starvation-inducible DNA-binding protein
MKPIIGISDKNIIGSISLLSIVLASEMVLYVKTRKAHWNVSGTNFYVLHQAFEAQFKDLEKIIDQVAERLGVLGDHSIGTFSEFEKKSLVKEEGAKNQSPKECIKELLDDHEHLAMQIRKNIVTAEEHYLDAGTASFFTSLLEKHETMAWGLRRTLE